MKKAVLLLATFLLFNVPAKAEDVINAETKLPNIFIWALPEDVVTTKQESKKEQKQKKKEEIEEQPISDITVENEEVSTEQEEEIPLVLNATTLKGYAEYVEDNEDIYLLNDSKKFVLKLKSPQTFKSQKIVDGGKIVPNREEIYSMSKFKGEEYSISPTSRNVMASEGNWSLGTTYSSGISTSQLESTTGLFTRYDRKHFAISSAYAKNNMMTRGLMTDSFYVIPEFKLNNIFAIQEVLSADMTRNRRSSELVFSVNPLGNRGIDRMKLEVGAKQTFDAENGNTSSQLRFSTKFKL